MQTSQAVLIGASSAANAWVVSYAHPAVSSFYSVGRHWNGRSWRPSGFPGGGTNIAANTSSQVVAAAHWNGHSWRVVPVPPRYPPRAASDPDPRILALSRASVWFDVAASTSRSRPVLELLHYDGTDWTRIRVPYRSTTVLGSMAPDGRGGMWIAATARKLPGGVMYDYRHGHWSRQAAPVPSGTFTSLESLTAIPGSTIAWAGGYELRTTGAPDLRAILYDYRA